MPTLNITVSSDHGVEKVRADVRTIAESKVAAEMAAALSFSLSLVSETAMEFAPTENKTKKLISPTIYVPRDEECGVFEEMTLFVASPVRSLFKDSPEWIINAVRSNHPQSCWWDNADDLPGGQTEAALSILMNSDEDRHWLDHCGWIGESEKSKLICEPYKLSEQDLAALIRFCANANLKYSIQGCSNHYPSGTLRIEISRD